MRLLILQLQAVGKSSQEVISTFFTIFVDSALMITD
ncbi:hypothetical protein NIES4072_32780 [Nostoc commune NIES-4072]|uniref:Uncharacterized protein n=1 Tax=Nostoc commune NIES-4072 TaxID=2005467 RepID=A0A2R5FLF4_NOSCO|nr:hypothetical protein NIES4072_32780 [Nostoc commune NIES-4072]